MLSVARACTKPLSLHLTLLNKQGLGWAVGRDRFTLPLLSTGQLCGQVVGTLPLLCTWRRGSSVPQVAFQCEEIQFLCMPVFSEFTVFLSSEIMSVLCHRPSKWCFHLIKLNAHVASPGVHFKVWVEVEDISVIEERTVENSRNQNCCCLAHAAFWDQFQSEVSPKIFYFLIEYVAVLQADTCSNL